MNFRSKAAMAVIAITALVVIGVGVVAVRTWQHRVVPPAEALPASGAVPRAG